MLDVSHAPDHMTMKSMLALLQLLEGFGTVGAITVAGNAAELL